ncbi:dihydropteroate synthase [archaeon]|jgi:dihydropteroate synthase|nr:dihydropteroate synthase [archaeon]MBT6698771.1 dihydropteroate synthase [archaeon]
MVINQFNVLLNQTHQENRTIIMGILNVTLDSFSDGGKFLDQTLAIKRAKQMIEDGADIIDIGGESTKPGSDPVPIETELNRVIPVIKTLIKEIPNIIISIDSMKPIVTNAALEAGAQIINDVTGLRDPDMINVAVKHQCPVIIMHMLGLPKTMQQEITETTYNSNCTQEIANYLKSQTQTAITAGIKKENIVLDPGIGFGKTVNHNLELINNIQKFKLLGYPILIGPSRKSFIGKLTKQALNLETIPLATDRLEGSLASITACALNGASILRVHDVKETKHALIIADALRKIK